MKMNKKVAKKKVAKKKVAKKKVAKKKVAKKKVAKKKVAKKKVAKKKVAKKKVAKKKVAKKVAKKKADSPMDLYDDWWIKTGSKKASSIEKKYLKSNPNYDPEMEMGGDWTYVHRMFHEREALDLTYDISRDVFSRVLNGDTSKPDQSEALYCELDCLVWEAYEKAMNLKGEKIEEDDE